MAVRQKKIVGPGCIGREGDERGAHFAYRVLDLARGTGPVQS